MSQLSKNKLKLTVGVKYYISGRITLSPNPDLVEEATCFPFFAPWYKLGIRFYIPLESTCCLFVAYCHEFLNRNHTIDLPYVLKENIKNLLFDLIPAGSFENLSCLSSCSLSQRWRFWRIRSNVLRGIGSDLAYT